LGGGILSYGDLEVLNSTFANNTRGATNGRGGALAFAGDGTVNIKNSTFYNNTSISGGAIYVESATKELYIENSTFSANDDTNGATEGGGEVILAQHGSKVYLKNNIFWGNDGVTADFSVVNDSSIISQGYNIFQEDPTASGFDKQTTDIIAQDPTLGVIAANGGRTWTMLPGNGGSADTNIIPAANMTLDEDQRGYARGQGAGSTSTIGAVELISDGSAATTVDVTRTITINKTGIGSSTITSSPAGISCGGTCADSSTFNARSKLTLTSAPVGGSYTVGWDGGDYDTDADYYNVNYPHQNKTIKVEIITKGVSYSKEVFHEANSNTGAITQTSTISIVGDTFTGTNGDNFVSSKVTVSNLPTGLTAVVTKVSDTELTLSFTGTATAHAIANTITNLTLTFLDGAFTTNNAVDMENSTQSDLMLRFYDANLSYVPLTFSEAETNNGVVLDTAEITLFGDTFTGSNADNFVTATKVAIANLPPGLTAIVKRASDTSLYINFTGAATNHLDANTISNLQLTFANSAFTGNNASAILSSTSPLMTMNFYTAKSVLV